ncbi:MAG: hypothetical protein V7L11_14680, partial [Nostoc sp.]|uniref:hypothetical protein n=1 Tax=Nostoc sp. TaxID=1180 RepID=UPI002FFB6EB8
SLLRIKALFVLPQIATLFALYLFQDILSPLKLLINTTQLNTFWWLMQGCTASLHCRLIFPPLLTNGYTSEIIT